MENSTVPKNDKVGKPPGTLQFIGTPKLEKTRMDFVQYSINEAEVYEDVTTEKVSSLIRTDQVNFLIVQGLQDEALARSIGQIFDLHILLLEDVLDTTQPPKYEEFEDQIFILARRMRSDKQLHQVYTEQLGLVVGKHFVIVFLESKPELLNAILNRIQSHKARIRTKGTFYLGYAILDRLVDNYLRITEAIGDRVEDLEDELLEHPKKDHLNQINTYKREINFLRRNVRPIQEVVFSMSRAEMPFREKDMKPFLQDLRDHTTQTLETIASYKESLENQLNIYNATVANKLNDIMMTLTIFSVIFIPLTFFAGIYGMNFKYFPELDYRFAYPVFWGTQILIVLGMLLYFRRKRWI